MTPYEKIEQLMDLLGLKTEQYAELYGIPAELMDDWSKGYGEPEEYLVRLLERLCIEDFKKVRKYKKELSQKTMQGGFLDRPTFEEFRSAGCGVIRG